MKLKPFFGSFSEDRIPIRVSRLFAIVGAVVVVYNVVALSLNEVAFVQILASPSVWLTLALTIAFFALSFSNRRFVKALHVVLIGVLASFTVLEQYNSAYSLGFLILFVLFLYKYKFLERHGLWILGGFGLYVVVLIEFSVYLSPSQGVGLEVIIFLGLFFTLVYIVYQSELNRIFFAEKRLRTNIQTLIKERDDLKQDIGEKQDRLEYLEETIRKSREEGEVFDLDACGLTPKEMDVVEVLVRYRASNKVISEKMSIKESTVKLHLYHIFNKCGVDDRFQLIELCRNNFI